MLLIGLLVGLASGAPAGDEVTALPGWSDPLPSKHYSGYISASPTKHIHYYLVESEGDPKTDPVVVWFNGGPGCSSLDGFLYEHGPFRLRYDGTNAPTLERFEFTWARLATMVYVEQPVGVGFSYSSSRNKTADYNCTDDTAAADNLRAIEALFSKFPEYADRDLFITGESYAGIYVPTLAEAILKSTNYTGPTLKGIAVGNGCTGNEIGICAFSNSAQGTYYVSKYLAQQAFAPRDLKEDLAHLCDWETPWTTDVDDACLDAVQRLDHLTRNLDTYCVYCDCQGGDARRSRHQLRQAPSLAHRIGTEEEDDDDDNPTTACIDSVSASAWLNQPDVQAALHVQNSNVSDWWVCGTPAEWSYTSTRPNLPRDTYPLLVSSIRVLVSATLLLPGVLTRSRCADLQRRLGRLCVFLVLFPSLSERFLRQASRTPTMRVGRPRWATKSTATGTPGFLRLMASRALAATPPLSTSLATALSPSPPSAADVTRCPKLPLSAPSL